MNSRTLRVDDLAPAPAAEDAVVTGALDGQVVLAVGRAAGAEVVRRRGLAEAGDVVQLAFDGQQRGAGDRLRRDPLAADVPEPARQQVLLEHDADAVEVVLGGHVEHGVVLVVEAAVLLGVARGAPRRGPGRSPSASSRAGPGSWR